MFFGSFSSAMDFRVNRAAAAPAMSVRMSSMWPDGLRFMPPESKVMPLPMIGEKLFAPGIAPVREHDERRRTLAALVHRQQESHLHLLDLLFAVHGAGHAGQSAQRAGLAGNAERVRLFADLVDQVAAEQGVARDDPDLLQYRCGFFLAGNENRAFQEDVSVVAAAGFVFVVAVI